ncbi:MAG TPA: RtcB family protein [Actinomycetota bacterium]|nr:RtcB family protein [Actinomycetota bacterium]
MKEIAPNLRSWASEIDDLTVKQAIAASRLPILAGPVALMPDAHLGKGATVGSVIPTDSAIIPSAVGVDIGCGMIAVETDRRLDQVPDVLERILERFSEGIPAGLGRWHGRASEPARRWLRDHPHPSLTPEQEEKALVQFGSLGSGNHFVELAADERDIVWIVMHSGSRGVGNQLATKHIALAKKQHQALEDPDLAYFLEGTPGFQAYVRDMLWAQEYAMANRRALMSAALEAFGAVTGGGGAAAPWINCHHNYAALEEHDGRKMWVTRKGAIRAGRGDLGVIPGSMGSKSYIVRGRGNPLSYESSAHGAGRRLSRGRARRELTLEDFTRAMSGRVWQARDAEALVDEAPQAYKDIDQVMADQADLVEIVHELRGILSYKGVESPRARGKRRSKRG